MTTRTPTPKSWSDAPSPAPQPAALPTFTVDHRLAWARLGRLAFSSSPPPLRDLMAQASSILRHHAIERCRGVVTAAARRLGGQSRKATRDARDWKPEDAAELGTGSADVQSWVSPSVERQLALDDDAIVLHVPLEAWPLMSLPGLVRITVEPHDA